ncbi:hypothetical protein K0M31_017969 [Melipona bicolor]|uniref:Uncharacterized protein n=1 Tax=Melipona bicolor TaxID=60889 RepID=A0AA40KEA1_9HYME|nr:hypothetical protein K0M31_017969 [Melipona bicolor]
MENGEIPDEDISASSMYDPSLGPKHASRDWVSVEGKRLHSNNLRSQSVECKN